MSSPTSHQTDLQQSHQSQSSPICQASLSTSDLGTLGLLAAIWGGSFIAMRIAVPELGTLLAADLRILLASLALLLFAKIRHIPLHWRHHYRAYLLAGLCGAALPFALLSYAAHLLPAALLALLNATCPLFVAVLSSLWLSESLNRRKVTGLLLGLGGVWLTVGGSAVLRCSPTLLAIAACLLGSACFALSGVIIKHHTCSRFTATKPIEPLAMATGAMVAAGLLVLPTLPFVMPAQMPSASALIAVVALALLPSALAQILFIPLVARIGPTRAMSVSFLVPLFSMLWGFLLLHEAIGINYVLGGLVVVVATRLVIQPVTPKPPVASDQPISSNHPI